LILSLLIRAAIRPECCGSARYNEQYPPDCPLKTVVYRSKVVREFNVDKVKYSIHDAGTPAMMNFLTFLDKARSKIRPWEENSHWSQRFSLQSG
jgi:hypothetical protein